MAKRTTSGARFIARERRSTEDQETVCTHHVKRESEIKRLKSGSVKRVKK